MPRTRVYRNEIRRPVHRRRVAAIHRDDFIKYRFVIIITYLPDGCLRRIKKKINPVRRHNLYFVTLCREYIVFYFFIFFLRNENRVSVTTRLSSVAPVVPRAPVAPEYFNFLTPDKFITRTRHGENVFILNETFNRFIYVYTCTVTYETST